MTYNMTNVQGKTATATAMVLFPQVARPKDGYRVVVWEHGTVGGGDDCAPSKNVIHPRFKIPTPGSTLSSIGCRLCHCCSRL